MTVQPNGTHAKEITLHFLKLTQLRATPQAMGKHIQQAKSLLSSGYTKEEIISVMDYVILEKHFDVYSLGYFSACIENVLRELTKRKEQALFESQKEQLQVEIAKVQAEARSEVVTDDESTKRNQAKARRFGVQSGFREKFNLDMFEEQRQDN